MTPLQQVLYISGPGPSLGLRDQAVEVRRDDAPPARVPIHQIESIVCFGPVSVSPPLMHALAERGGAVTWLGPTGRFLARAEGPCSGNVLLRRAQHRASEGAQALEIARSMVLGKLANTRTLLRRGARERVTDEASAALRQAADALSALLPRARAAGDLDTLRGVEGQGAALAFGVFGRLLHGDESLRFTARSRRPPRDEVNAALSFLYALLSSDCAVAAQAVGLDPQMGFLHQDRPGRPSLALDLMEELRAPLADRALVSLVNQRQLKPDHFDRDPTGATLLNAAGRKVVLSAWSERKQRTLTHPFLEVQTPYAMLPHLQARISWPATCAETWTPMCPS